MKPHLTLFLLLSCHSLTAQRKEQLLTLETNFGEMKIILFDDTPKHKANFLKLTNEKFFEDLLFHRVINDFMIQGGDPESRNAEKGVRLGSGGDELDRIPFEFTTKHVHIKGALAAARDGNAEKASSACQFYIVTGKKYTEAQIKQTENSIAARQTQREKFAYTPEQIKAYSEIGGTPFLDNNYTVFGQVIHGIEVAEKIQKVKTDKSDRPEEDIKMRITTKKISKKKITKLYGYKFS